MGTGPRSIAQIRKGAGSNTNIGGQAVTNNADNKVLIPLNDQIIQKAKACQEMIMYERHDASQASIPHVPPQSADQIERASLHAQ